MKEFIKLSKNARFRRTMRMLFSFVWQFWKLGKQKKFISKTKANAKTRALYRKQAKVFTENAVDMGGLIIKLGQHVSARIDILPKEYTEELAKLQDSVAPVDSTEIYKALEHELGKSADEVYAHFDQKPLAAASLGQVHRATLHSGEEVAVKVMRPGIEDIIAIDLKSLQVAIKILQKRTKIGNYMDLDAVYEEFHETINDELDFEKEGRNAEEFQLMFIDRDDVIVPKIYWDYSSKKVLTMEFLEGVKISEIKQLNRWKIDRKQLAQRLFDIYIRQVLVDGFFHADPHPGNVLVQRDGTIALVDYGMVGRLTEDMKEQMISLIMATYMKDASGVIDALLKLKFLRRNADLDVLSRSLNLIFEQFDGSNADLSFLMGGDMAEELRDFIYTQPFQVPANTTFLGKAMMTVYGLCTALDKDFDVIENAKPYVEDVIGGDFTGNILGNILDDGKNILLGIIPTTKKMISAVNKIETGGLTVKLHKSFENRMIENQNQNTSRIVAMIFGAVLFWTGFQVWGELNDYVVYGIWIVGMLVMLSQLRAKKPKKRSGKHGKRMKSTGIKKPKFHP